MTLTFYLITSKSIGVIYWSPPVIILFDVSRNTMVAYSRGALEFASITSPETVTFLFSGGCDKTKVDSIINRRQNWILIIVLSGMTAKLTLSLKGFCQIFVKYQYFLQQRINYFRRSCNNRFIAFNYYGSLH